MSVKSFILPFIIAMFAITPTLATLPYGWTDPDDMGAPPDYFKYSEEAQNLELSTGAQKSQDYKMFDLYFRRTINMLLNCVHEGTVNDNLYSGHLFFELGREKYAILHDFANGRRNIELAQIDEVLSDLLSKPSHEHLQLYLETYFHRILNFLLMRETILSIMALTYCIIVYKLFHARFRVWQITKFLIINLILVDFAITAISRYQNAQIKKLADLVKYKTMPYECNPEKMTSLQFVIKYFRDDDECEKYHEILYKDPFWSISLLGVFGEMFSNLIKKPAIAIGEGFGNISSKIFYSLPYPINIVMFPIIMIFFCFITLLILSIAFKVPIKFNILHLFSLSFGDNSKSQTQNMISEKTVQKILDRSAPRKFIEELPVGTKFNAVNRKMSLNKLKSSTTNFNVRENKNKMEFFPKKNYSNSQISNITQTKLPNVENNSKSEKSTPIVRENATKNNVIDVLRSTSTEKPVIKSEKPL